MAIQYSKIDKKNLDNAVKKARAVKPHVKPLDFGRFEVTGSDGTPYNVTFYKSNGEFTFTCSCRGHGKNLVCYHSVACSGAYKLQVAERAATKAAPVPELPVCHDCGAVAFAYTLEGAFCINCIAEGAADGALGLRGSSAPVAALVCGECGLDNSDAPGGDDGLEYCYSCGGDLPRSVPTTEQEPTLQALIEANRVAIEANQVTIDALAARFPQYFGAGVAV